MADDIRSDIIINVDTSVGIAEIKNLQRAISQLNAQLLQSGARQARAAQDIQNNLIKNINATGKFAANVRSISTTAESFTTALERNKLSMGEYFRYAGASTKTFGRLFRNEFDTIEKVARERVKTLQTQYIKLGRDANGALKAIAVRPLALDMNNLATQTALAAQKQQLFNQLLKQGSTNLLNFGKNTQWAGRQLMVGFTIPLGIMAMRAGKEFEKIEKQAIRFRRVYGDAFSTTAETEKALDSMRQLADEFTKYGIEVEKTLQLAADAAQMGLKDAELRAQVTEATRLATLGEVEQQEALQATISVTNAFGTAAVDLAKKINFLNAVENETITAINDLTIAIPKAGPVVKQLGGDVEDLTFFLTAMKEGGINASEGANALKSGLASLINPTDKAAQMLLGLGINLREIVEVNKGNVTGVVVDFARALDTLDPLSRARAIEQLFGKFQFSRLSTLFQNVIKEGSQAAKVLNLANKGTVELAIIAERELKRIEESPLFKFKQQLEQFQAALAPLGAEFMKAVTPIIKFGTELLKNFNGMSDGAKQFTVIATTLIAGIGPIFLMAFGLIANGAANIIKLFANMMKIFTGVGKGSRDLGLSTDYMTQQQLEAAAVASSLNQKHVNLTQTFAVEAAAVSKLATAYGTAVVQQSRLLGLNPETLRPFAAGRGAKPRKLASGIFSVPGPKGAGDIVPAMLSPGESVIPAKQTQKYAPLIQGMINDNIPGFKFGFNPFARLMKNIKPESTNYGLLEGILRMLTGTRTGAYNRTNDMYTDVMAKKFIRSNPRIAVRMPVDKLIQMAQSKDKRYKSVFETGFSQAGDTAAKRALAEQKLFNLSPEADPRLRPVYGYLFKKERQVNLQGVKRKGGGWKKTAPSERIFEALSGKKLGINIDTKAAAKRLMFDNTGSLFNPKTYMYGNAAMELNKRAIKDRATFTYGDSYNSWAQRFATPAPLGTRSAKKIKGSYTSRDKSFFEAQILGGFTLKDVKRIIVSEPALIPQLQAVLRANGLKIPVRMPRFTMLQKLKKLVYGKRAQVERLPFTAKYGPKAGKYTNPPIKVGNRKVWLNGGVFDLPEMEKPFTRESARGKKIVEIVDELRSRSREKPSSIAKLTSRLSWDDLSKEDKIIEESLRRSGLTGDKLKSQVKSLVGADLSHISPTEKRETIAGRELAMKEWVAKGLIKDHRTINQVLENMGKTGNGKFLKDLASPKALVQNAEQMASATGLSVDETKKALKKVAGNKRHPTSKAEYLILREIAKKYQELSIKNKKSTNVARAQALIDLINYRVKTEGSSGSYFRQLKNYNEKRASSIAFSPKAAAEVDRLAQVSRAVLIKNAQDKILKITGNKRIPFPILQSDRQTKDLALAAKAARKAKITTPPKIETPSQISTTKQTYSLGKMFRGMRGFGALASILGLGSMMFSGNVLKASKGIFSVPGPKGAGDIVPAMLSPGESVIPAEQSRKYAPLVSAMISDSIPGYRFGKQDSQAQQMANAEAMSRLGLAYNARGQLVDSETKRFVDKSRRQEFDNLRTNKELLKEQKALLKEQTRLAKEEKMAQRGMRGQGSMMVGGTMATAGAMMMMNPEQQQMGGALMGIGTAMSVLPMLIGANPFIKVIAAVAALAGGLFLLGERLKAATKAGMETSDAMSMTSEKLIAISETVGTVSASQIAQEERKNLLSGVAEIDRKFGMQYMESEVGKSLMTDIQKQITAGMSKPDVAGNIGLQFADAISQNVLTPKQVASIVASIGTQLNDYTFSAQVNAKIMQLIGPNGEDLTKDPLEVALRIQVESSKEVEKAFAAARAGQQNPLLTPTEQFGTGISLNPIGLGAGAVVAGLGAAAAFSAASIGAANFWNPVGWAAIAVSVGLIAKSLFDANEVQAKNVQLNSLAISRAGEELALNQQRADAIKRAYDLKIEEEKSFKDIAESNLRNAKTDKERAKYTKQIEDSASKIATYQQNQNNALAEFNASSATQYENYVDYVNKLKREDVANKMNPFAPQNQTDEILLKTVEARYKDDPLGLELAKKQLEAIKQISDQDLQTNLQLAVVSGTMSTSTVERLIKLGDSNKPMQAKFQLLISQQGVAGLDTFIQLMNQIGTSDAAIPAIFGSFLGLEADKFDERLAALSAIASVDAVGFDVSLEVDGQKKIDNVVDTIRDLEKIEDPITRDIIVDLAKENPALYDAVLADYDRLAGADGVITRQVLVSITATAQSAKAVKQFVTDLAGQGNEAAKRDLEVARNLGAFGDQFLMNKYGYQAGVYYAPAGETEKPEDKKTGDGNLTGDGEKENVLDSIFERLKRVRDAAIGAKRDIQELMKLMKPGTTATTLFRGTDQQLLFAGYSKDFINQVMSMDEETRKTFINIKNGIVTVTKEGKALSRALSEISLGDYQFSLAAGVADINKQKTAMGLLIEQGMSAEDAFEAVKDTQLAYAISTAATTEEIQELVKWSGILINKQKELETSTPKGMQSYLSKRISEVTGALSMVSDYFAAREAQVEQDFQQGTNLSNRNASLFNVGKINKDIKAAQDEIISYQEAIDDLNYQLTFIEDQENKINEEYDKRLEALDKIEKANEAISAQQKSQLSLADALSRGDISAAAATIQDIRTASTAQSIQSQRDLLEQARQKKLESLTVSVNGKLMTRKQIEEETESIMKNIAKIEEDRLEPSQKLLRNAENIKQLALEAIGEEGYLGKTKTAWGNIENAVKLATVESNAFNASLIAILKTMSGFVFDKDGKFIGFDPNAYKESLPDPNFKTKTEKEEGPKDINPNKPGIQTSVYQAKGVTVLNKDIAAKSAIAAVKSGIASDPLAFANQVRDTILANREAVRNNKSLSAAQKDALIKENIDLMKSTGLKFAMGGMVPKRFAMGGKVSYYPMGGLIPYKAEGGSIFKPLGTDTVPAMLTPGEFVVRKYAVDNFGVDRLKAINNGTYKGDSMYNYEVNVNVQTDANPDQIARAVMGQIRNIESQRIRGNRF